MADEKFTQQQVDNIVAEKMKGVLSQDKVDAIVQDRLARERAKYSDYDDLKKKVSDYEGKQSEQAQKDLEARKEYDKAKETYEKKITDLSDLVSKKDAEINDGKINSALMFEITKQNAYAEEALALLKSQAVFDKEGNIRIKGRDANGLEIADSVEEGVKRFLTARPHLVKATNRAGGGTPPANPVGGAGAGEDDLASLNAKLLEAQRRGDAKLQRELTVKIKAQLAYQGMRR